MPPKPCATAFLVLLLVTILQLRTVQANFQLTYTIEVHADGAARWIVEMKGMDVPTSFDSFTRFVENTSRLLEIAKQQTQRNMTANGFSMSVNVSGSYKIVTYHFAWREFAEVQDKQVIVGDVFFVESFFSYLYGDGEVFIIYPSDYSLESVSPSPSEQADEAQTIEWYGINDFKSGEPHVVLIGKIPSSPLDIIGRNTAFIFGLLAFAGASVGLYYLRFRRKTMKKELEPQTFVTATGFQVEDEEKVANLLRSAGGSMYQSVIADQCDFSRSKASKLLAAMEGKGKVRREDKGREKVVTLIDGKEEADKTKKSC